jgi:hypothetical protein
MHFKFGSGNCITGTQISINLVPDIDKSIIKTLQGSETLRLHWTDLTHRLCINVSERLAAAIFRVLMSIARLENT